MNYLLRLTHKELGMIETRLPAAMLSIRTAGTHAECGKRSHYDLGPASLVMHFKALPVALDKAQPHQPQPQSEEP